MLRIRKPVFDIMIIEIGQVEEGIEIMKRHAEGNKSDDALTDYVRIKHDS